MSLALGLNSWTGAIRAHHSPAMPQPHPWISMYCMEICLLSPASWKAGIGPGAPVAPPSPRLGAQGVDVSGINWQEG